MDGRRKKIRYLFYKFQRFSEIQMKILNEILSENKETSLGKKFEFDQIKSIDQYQNSVPISTYESYINGNISVYPIQYILQTSGSTGTAKRINLTEKALKQYGSYIYDMPKVLTHNSAGKSMHTSVFHYQENPTFLSSAYYSYLYENKFLNKEEYIEGDLLFTNETYCAPYVKLRLALQEENLASIESIYLYEIILFADYLYKNWELLLTDIENQRISIEIPFSMSSKLLSKPCKNNRISYLKNLFRNAEGNPTFKQIWPHLKYVSGIGQEPTFSVQKLRALLDDIPIYFFAYASSECMCGISTTMNEDIYTLLPDTAFYEFLDANQKICAPQDLKIGNKYELLITTFTGLYRYRTFDQLLFVGYEGTSPKVRVLGRINKILNIAGERVNEWSIAEAMNFAITQAKSPFFDYGIGIDDQIFPARYIVFLTVPELWIDRLAWHFDIHLQKINPNYKKLRQTNSILPPKFVYKESIKKIQNHGHLKPNPILNKAEVKSLQNE